MQRFAVSQKNRTEAISISPFSLSLLYRTENKRFSTINCTKTGSTQPKLSAACFVVQSCLADADFVVFSNYCLIGTRQRCCFALYRAAEKDIAFKSERHRRIPAVFSSPHSSSDFIYGGNDPYSIFFQPAVNHIYPNNAFSKNYFML